MAGASHAELPDTIADTTALEELLSEPTDGVVDALSRLEGDIVILGAGGKMGPTLARMAARASESAGLRRRVVAVSRFSDPRVGETLRLHGVETLECDLLDADAVSRLPRAANVVYMAGRKFGTGGDPSLTWAMNAVVPVLVSRHFGSSRFVVFSTGNVYGLAPVRGGGSRETDAPRPEGEYATSALARERIFEHASRTSGAPSVILRLNYATEMRYGVLVDLALKVRDGEPIDLAMGWVNVIWQADANAAALRAFDHAAVPARILNVSGPEVLRVREVCEELGRRLEREPRFVGQEAPDALLSDGGLGRRLLGGPRVDAKRLVAWTADWVRRGGETLGRPTHFESREGTF